MEGYLRYSPNGHVEKRTNANNTPCLHRIASGVLSMGPWVKVRLSNVGLGLEEETPLDMASIGRFVLEWYTRQMGT